MFGENRTKIITTIGPASENIEIMKKLFENGMTTIRLNFSHGDFEEHGARITSAKKIRKETGKPLSVMLDTKGPEIRVGEMKNGKQQVNAGQIITIYTSTDEYNSKVSDQGEMTVSHDMSKDLAVGKVVLVDDGKLQLTVTEIKPGIVVTKARNSHLVKTNKRINLPGTKFSMPFLAKKDKEDIKFGIKEGIDFIAASFVNTADDIKEIKSILKEYNAEEIKIFAKIESQYAVDNFDAILKETDGVMIARGDLGLEIPYYEVPVVEKMIIRKMRNAGKPVIVATQMLDSMENNPHPTRAEVTDVYFATELGADATMLSGESAAGNYPVEAVHVMATINKRAEKEFYNKIYYNDYIKSLPEANDDRSKRARNVTMKAKSGDYKLAIVLSRTGKLLEKIAQYRPNINIIGVVKDPKQINKFGVTSSVFNSIDENAFDDIKKDFNLASKIAVQFGIQKGEKYLAFDAHEVHEFTHK